MELHPLMFTLTVLSTHFQKTMTEILVKHISSTLSIGKTQVSNTVKLLEEGAMSLCELHRICTIYFYLKL